MSTAADAERLAERARELVARRDDATRGLAGQADELAETCRQMARRFHLGGKVMAFGNGGPTTDAQHVSVEFVHPVIVGKPALPAVSLNADGASLSGLVHRHGAETVYAHLLGVLGRADDIALGLSSDGRDTDVLRGLEAAHACGMLTVALVGDPTSPIAVSPAVDHVVTVDSDDPAIVKEVHVTAYHVLWELVHVFLEQPGLLEGGLAGRAADRGSVEALYPFLYEGGADLPAVLADVARSTHAKIDEIVELRARVGARSPSPSPAARPRWPTPSRPAASCSPSATEAAAPTRRRWHRSTSRRTATHAPCPPSASPTTWRWSRRCPTTWTST